MTNVTGASLPPAGWYPDHTGAPQLRWWDGAGWTDHVQRPPAPQVSAPQSSPVAPYSMTPYSVATSPSRVADGTPVYNPFIWLLVLVPLAGSAITTLLSMASGSSPTSLAGVGIGFVAYLVYVLFAFLDYRRLLADGYERPFHWAWTFLGWIVYAIGRPIIVGRRSGRGYAVLWTAIAVVVVLIVISVVTFVNAYSTVYSNFPTNA